MGQQFPCASWCNGVGCGEHADQAIVHRETPEPPVISPYDPEQLLTLTLEQHDDPHGIQPGEPFVVLAVSGTAVALDAERLGQLTEAAAAARMRLLAARGEPVVPIPRRRRAGERPRR